MIDRRSGVLLHPTSLPGAHGIGDLGDAALRWLDFLAAGRQALWQVLPLGPPGYGESPYAARSAFAGNPLLISLDRLAEDGLLNTGDLVDAPAWPAGRVDYAAVETYKMPRLRAAFARFTSTAPSGGDEFAAFARTNQAWLDDWALFAALRDVHDGAAWNTWEPELVRREPVALAEARARLDEAIDFHCFVQFIFARQWGAVHDAARAAGINIVGDIPIFVAHDSADVWAHQDLFLLDRAGEPTVVAGVPPDYFSPTGQRWGNPLYNWGRLRESGYAWWIDRFRATLSDIDLVRIDHFRGFEAYWEVPAAEATALRGRWQPGPGAPFFAAVSDALGSLPVIVEDLGLITEPVHDLRRTLGYPGMKVLQFAFGDDAANPYLPHNYERNYVVYTGTHDNDTTEGWFAALSAEERARVLNYAGSGAESISRTLMRLALRSVARMAIIPLQDVLGLGNEARMNLPGESRGNWSWQATAAQIDPAHATWLAETTTLYGRTERVAGAG